MYLIFDTETTGLPKNGFNPHITELAAMLVNNDLEEQAVLNVLIRPEGWEIPEEAATLTGISTDQCHKYGVPLSLAMQMFSEFAKGAVLVAHNYEFDKDMLERSGFSTKGHFYYCTMENTTPLMKLPPSERMKRAGYGNKYKPPKLIEAYKHFYGKEFQGAHRALTDVKACRAVFSALRKQGL